MRKLIKYIGTLVQPPEIIRHAVPTRDLIQFDMKLSRGTFQNPSGKVIRYQALKHLYPSLCDIPQDQYPYTPIYIANSGDIWVCYDGGKHGGLGIC